MDDKTQRGGQDRKRIDVSEDYELRDWSKKFGVTPDELKKAVAEAGNSADAVEKHLASKRSAGGQRGGSSQHEQKPR